MFLRLPHRLCFALSIGLLSACSDGPTQVDAKLLDSGDLDGAIDDAQAMDRPLGPDLIGADTGGEDAGPAMDGPGPLDLDGLETGVEDQGPIDQGNPPDGGADAGADLGLDGGKLDVGPTDLGPDVGVDLGPDTGVDLGTPDLGLDAGLDAGFDAGQDAGQDLGLDAGPPDFGADAGLVILIEDFTDAANVLYTCPAGTVVDPQLLLENGLQCVGFDGSRCPAEAGLPGPGDAECADPGMNPFIGAGQCVSDFFACFNPGGVCVNSGTGTFTWGSGARQEITFTPLGELIRAEFFPSGAILPCVVGMLESPGATRVVYVQQ